MIKSPAQVIAASIFLSLTLAGCAKRVDWDDPRDRLREAFEDERVQALALAAEKGDLKRIDRLIDAGVDVNYVGKHGVTPLLCALAAPTTDSLERLLQHGADPNTQLADGTSVMSDVAGKRDGQRWLEIVLDHGGDPNLLDTRNRHIPNDTPLFDAIRANNFPGVELLIDAGADVNYRNGQHKTPLDCTLQFYHFQIAQVLIEAGADFRANDAFGRSLLLAIVDKESSRLLDDESERWLKEVFDLLEEKGVDIDQIRHDLEEEQESQRGGVATGT